MVGRGGEGELTPFVGLDRCKIILARSPAHLHSVIIEYRRQLKVSLSKAIKVGFSGTLQNMLLYAVEHAKNDHDGPGICASNRGSWTKVPFADASC